MIWGILIVFCYLGMMAVLPVRAIMNSPARRYTTVFPGDENPHRRKCVRCGQVQHEMSVPGRYPKSGRIGWYNYWDDMLPITDPNCRCHKDTEDHG